MRRSKQIFTMSQLTFPLHECEELVQEFLALGVVVDLVQLKIDKEEAS